MIWLTAVPICPTVSLMILCWTWVILLLTGASCTSISMATTGGNTTYVSAGMPIWHQAILAAPRRTMTWSTSTTTSAPMRKFTTAPAFSGMRRRHLHQALTPGKTTTTTLMSQTSSTSCCCGSAEIRRVKSGCSAPRPKGNPSASR